MIEKDNSVIVSGTQVYNEVNSCYSLGAEDYNDLEANMDDYTEDSGVPQENGHNLTIKYCHQTSGNRA
jgi:hypothetical protein